MAYAAQIGTMTIPSGQTKSNPVGDQRTFGGCSEVVIYAPPALTGTVTLQVSTVPGSTTDADYSTLQFPAGTDFTISAGKAVVLPVGALNSMRVVSTNAEGAARAFSVMGQFATR